MTKSVAIIGASRGIGLGFARAYAGEGWNTHVTTRAIGEPGELGKIKGNITIHNLDVRNSQQIEALAKEFTDIGIDVLIQEYLARIAIRMAIVVDNKYIQPSAYDVLLV